MGKITEEKLLQSIVQELISVRKEKGLTQQQVFIDTGIHIGRIEQGKRSMALTTFINLCTYYEVKSSTVLLNYEQKLK